MTDNETTVERLRRQLEAIQETMISRNGPKGAIGFGATVLVSRKAYEKVYDARQALPKRWFSTFDTEFEIETYKRGAVTRKKVILPDGSFYTQKEVVHGFVAIQNAIQVIKEYGLS